VALGRFSQGQYSELSVPAGSRFSWHETSTSTDHEPVAAIAVWGVNRDGATALMAHGAGETHRVNDLRFGFFDQNDRDITSSVIQVRRDAGPPGPTTGVP
jgi:hypothetical protein